MPGKHPRQSLVSEAMAAARRPDHPPHCAAPDIRDRLAGSRRRLLLWCFLAASALVSAIAGLLMLFAER